MQCHAQAPITHVWLGLPRRPTQTFVWADKRLAFTYYNTSLVTTCQQLNLHYESPDTTKGRGIELDMVDLDNDNFHLPLSNVTVASCILPHAILSVTCLASSQLQSCTSMYHKRLCYRSMMSARSCSIHKVTSCTCLPCKFILSHNYV